MTHFSPLLLPNSDGYKPKSEFKGVDRASNVNYRGLTQMLVLENSKPLEPQ